MDQCSPELAGSRGAMVAVAAGLMLVGAAYAIRCAFFWGYVNDDAFITFRYSGFLALGRGPYFNVGEQVEGYTNFLLMVLLAPVYWTVGAAAVPIAAKAIGVASGIGSLILAWATTRLVARELSWLRPHASAVGVAAAALVAASPAYAVNSTSGLATALFGFFLILGLFLMLRAERQKTWCGAGVAFAALVLTRPEGPYLFGIAWLGAVAGVAFRQRERARVAGDGDGERGFAAYRRCLLDGGIVAAAFAGLLLFRVLAYDGEWLPNTYYAKAAGFWKVDAWSYVREGILDPFFGPAGAALAVGGAALAAARAPFALSLLAVAIAGVCLPFVTGTDWMVGWRMLMPVLPVVACAAALGWATLLARLLPRMEWVAPSAVIAAALALALMQLPLQAKLDAKLSLRNQGYATGHSALAEWLCGQAAEPGDAIALMDIGIIGYRCIDHPILDISGLTDRFIAKSEGPFLFKEYDPAYVLEKQPRFVVLVITLPGRPYEAPPPDPTIGFWTRVEWRLYAHEGFQRRYVHVPEELSLSGDWRQDLAQRMGAVRIFEHAHPGKHYLLAVFDSQS